MKKGILIAVLAIALTACAPAITSTPPATFTPVVESPTTLPTFTAFPTLIAFPTPPNVPPPTIEPTSTPLPAVLPKFPLDGYVMLFTKDGDLYFQDGENTPVKLTYIGEPSHEAYFSPKLSDDNQKVVFTRSDNIIYSINTDGTQEHIVISSEWLKSLKIGTKLSAMNFVPGTHQLLFQVVLCESQEFRSPCTTSIFLADADTGNIKKLADLGLTQQKDRISRNIEVSPNGKMIAVGTMEDTYILNMNGKVIRNNILPYTPSQRTMLFPSLFWLRDSKGLIAALPDAIYHSIADGDLPAHTIWHYMIESNASFQIPFEPPPMLDTFQVSPDGNWIVYGGLPNDNSVYLGNLTDGHKQIFGNAYQVYFSWGPDSKYFIATSAGSVLGTIDTPILIPTCQLNKWIDANHFTCWNTGKIRMAEIASAVIKVYDLVVDDDVEGFVLIKPK